MGCSTHGRMKTWRFVPHLRTMPRRMGPALSLSRRLDPRHGRSRSGRARLPVGPSGRSRPGVSRSGLSPEARIDTGRPQLAGPRLPPTWPGGGAPGVLGGLPSDLSGAPRGPDSLPWLPDRSTAEPVRGVTQYPAPPGPLSPLLRRWCDEGVSRSLRLPAFASCPAVGRPRICASSRMTRPASGEAGPPSAPTRPLAATAGRSPLRGLPRPRPARRPPPDLAPFLAFVAPPCAGTPAARPS